MFLPTLKRTFVIIWEGVECEACGWYESQALPHGAQAFMLPQTTVTAKQSGVEEGV